MADITSLTKKVANAISRQATGFVRKTTSGAPDTYNFYNFGIIKDGNININPVNTDKDHAGRAITIAYDVEVSFVMLQTSKDEIAVLGDIVGPDGYDATDGHFIFMSDQPATAATAYTGSDGNPDVDGFAFGGVIPQVTGAFPLDGSQQMVTIEFSGRIPTSAFDSFNVGNGFVITFNS